MIATSKTFFKDFFMMFGGPEPVAGRLPIPSDMHLDIHARVTQDFGWFRMSGSDELPFDGRELSFAIEHEQGHFEVLEMNEPGWRVLPFAAPMFRRSLSAAVTALFALDSRWRLCIIWYLFWRLLRIRSDAIFFHASALGIFGEGTIFVGPAGGGKSTTSMALAARGHNFLSDEIAAYLPERGELIPFRRPVGIKRGPRSSAVERGLRARGCRADRAGWICPRRHRQSVCRRGAKGGSASAPGISSGVCRAAVDRTHHAGASRTRRTATAYEFLSELVA